MIKYKCLERLTLIYKSLDDKINLKEAKKNFNAYGKKLTKTGYLPECECGEKHD
jgi:hypothetical protein